MGAGGRAGGGGRRKGAFRIWFCERPAGSQSDRPTDRPTDRMADVYCTMRTVGASEARVPDVTQKRCPEFRGRIFQNRSPRVRPVQFARKEFSQRYRSSEYPPGAYRLRLLYGATIWSGEHRPNWVEWGQQHLLRPSVQVSILRTRVFVYVQSITNINSYAHIVTLSTWVVAL